MIVFVRKKTPLAQLRPKDVVPLRIGGVPTDVVQVGSVGLLAHPAPLRSDKDEGGDGSEVRRVRWRPPRPGVSFGHAGVSAGTLGAVMKDRNTGELFMLSNNHVAANGTDGRDGRAEPGDPVLQPGAYDGGTEARDVVGRLDRFVPLHPLYGEPRCPWAKAAEGALRRVLAVAAPGYDVRLLRRRGEDNLVDCARVRPVAGVAPNPDIVGLGPVRGRAEADVGTVVRKSGRTSGVTSGKVIAVGATLHVGLDGHAVARFADQIVTTPLGQPGDSGSLVVDEAGRAVGLLFAGSEEATLCNRIAAVCEALELDF